MDQNQTLREVFKNNEAYYIGECEMPDNDPYHSTIYIYAIYNIAKEEIQIMFGLEGEKLKSYSYLDREDLEKSLDSNVIELLNEIDDFEIYLEQEKLDKMIANATTNHESNKNKIKI